MRFGDVAREGDFGDIGAESDGSGVFIGIGRDTIIWMDEDVFDLADVTIGGLIGRNIDSVGGFYFGAEEIIGDGRAGGGMILGDFSIATWNGVPGVVIIQNAHVLGEIRFGGVGDFGDFHGPVRDGVSGFVGFGVDGGAGGGADHSIGTFYIIGIADGVDSKAVLVGTEGGEGGFADAIHVGTTGSSRVGALLERSGMSGVYGAGHSTRNRNNDREIVLFLLGGGDD